jgi:hypothetical protein
MECFERSRRCLIEFPYKRDISAYQRITCTSIPVVTPDDIGARPRALLVEACILTALLADRDSRDYQKRRYNAAQLQCPMIRCNRSSSYGLMCSLFSPCALYRSRFWCEFCGWDFFYLASKNCGRLETAPKIMAVAAWMCVSRGLGNEMHMDRWLLASSLSLSERSTTY